MQSGFKYFFIASFALLQCFKATSFAQTPEQLRSWLPVIENWNLSQEVEVFDRDHLYERINGAAPLFFENNFREMTSLEYTRENSYITIQAYRHATPEDALGMYASERSSDMTFYTGIGGEAQGDGDGLYFFAGKIYVKMMASEESETIQEIMKQIAACLAKNIDYTASYPSVFSTFPQEGLIPHTKAYITQNYIGHEFLKPVYVADYEQNGMKFQAFVIDGKTTEGARQILETYFKFTAQKEELIEGNLLIKDRYNGNIPVVWSGRYIVGAFNDQGKDFPEMIYIFLNRLA